jgi:16S rRNA (cytidine1402-2'-O)-methyltransferase
MKGKIYLIPITLGPTLIEHVIPEYVKRIICTIDYYIVENVRTARRFLKKAGIQSSIDDLRFMILDKHTQPEEPEFFLLPIYKNKNIGIISEAGVPCIADPGAEIVRLAHAKNIQVIPLTGPSSIFLALMASGLNGQNFAFVGYLPVKSPDRIKKFRFLEKRSREENQSQIFMETPYRNQKLLEDLLKTCRPDTKLCIACDITFTREFIKTKTIQEWKANIPDINKRPAIFILQGY